MKGQRSHSHRKNESECFSKAKRQLFRTCEVVHPSWARTHYFDLAGSHENLAVSDALGDGLVLCWKNLNVQKAFGNPLLWDRIHHLDHLFMELRRAVSREL